MSKINNLIRFKLNIKFNKFETKITAILFLLPALIFMFYAVYIPFIWNGILSFQNWNGFLKKEWIGLGNYTRALQDPLVLKSLFNSTFLAVISTVGAVVIGVLLAALIFKVTRKEGALYRLIIFMPVMLPTAIVALLFTFVFNPEMGILNNLLKLVGLGSLTNAWLEDKNTVMWCLTFVNIWKMSGLTMILAFAAMQMLPASTFESSKLDGATYIKQFIYIILPLIKSIIQIATVYILAVTFKSYDLVFVMTRGGPGEVSYTVPINMMTSGFTFNEYGYAASMGIILTVVVVAIVGIVNKVLGGEQYEY